MEFIKDRDLVSRIYDVEENHFGQWNDVRKNSGQFIEDMKGTTGVTRDIQLAEVFDFSFVRKVNQELEGWNP